MKTIAQVEKPLWILITAFVLLNAVDILLTLHQVGNGNGTELNPIMAIIIKQPAYISIAYKIVGSAVFAVLVTQLPGKFKRLAPSILRIVVACMALVCLLNIIGMMLV